MAVDLVGKHRHSYQIYMCTRRSVCGFVEVNCKMRSPIPTFHGLEFRSLESEFWTGFLILFPNWFHQWQVHIGHHFYEGSCHYMAGIIWMILSLRKWKWIPSSSWCPWICCTLRFMLLSCLQFMIFFWLIYLFLVEGKES